MSALATWSDYCDLVKLYNKSNFGFPYVHSYKIPGVIAALCCEN